MRIRVCSGFSPAGRLQYGERFLQSFDRFWPRDVELQVWVEEPTSMPRDAYRDLWSIPGAREFAERHADNLEAHGRVPRAGWKDKDRRGGYCFKFDAYKFWKQILIPQAASAGLEDGDVLIWLDADVVTFQSISKLDILALLGKADVAYLGRSQSHSEIGFWAVRMGPRVRSFLGAIAIVYTTDEVFELAEWHSAFVWDTVRKVAGLREQNLCKPGARGHVWPMTRLGHWMRHDKGPRKPR